MHALTSRHGHKAHVGPEYLHRLAVDLRAPAGLIGHAEKDQLVPAGVYLRREALSAVGEGLAGPRRPLKAVVHIVPLAEVAQLLGQKRQKLLHLRDILILHYQRPQH